MNLLSTAVFLLSLTLTACSHYHHHEDPALEKRKKMLNEIKEHCKTLCKYDGGMDADMRSCLTDCASSTDSMTHHQDEGFEHFVHDEGFNEKGGQKMVTYYNENFDDEVPKCAPQEGYEAGTTPEFNQLDLNKDGVITGSEAVEFGAKACIDDEMIMQIFSQADLNLDKKIDKKEWDEAGEDTPNEKAMDKALEKMSQGDDEYDSVQNPPLEEFDKDKSGGLDENEMKNVVKHEVMRRTEHAPIPEKKEKELDEAAKNVMTDVDKDGNGVVSGSEYAGEKSDPEGMDEELKEAREADEDKQELDDLHRVDASGGAADGANVGLLAHRSKLRNGHHKRRGNAKLKLNYAEAILAKARFQQRLRRVMFLQHQRRLRQAALLHKAQHRRALRERK